MGIVKTTNRFQKPYRLKTLDFGYLISGRSPLSDPLHQVRGTRLALSKISGFWQLTTVLTTVKIPLQAIERRNGYSGDF